MKKMFVVLLIAMMLMLAMPEVLAAQPVDVAPASVSIDITGVVTALIGLLAALITRKLIPNIKAKTSESQFSLLESSVRIAVYAAEQIYGALHGNEKLKYVQAYLAGKGYNVDTLEIRNLIEAYVHELSTQNAKQPARDTKKDAQTSATE